MHNRLERRSLSLREGLAIAIFIVFLGAQILIPLVRFSAPRPARFNWQMYAAMRPQQEFTAVFADGSAQRIDHTQYLRVERLELDFDEHFIAYLCDTYEGAVMIRAVEEGRDTPREHPCAR